MPKATHLNKGEGIEARPSYTCILTPDTPEYLCEEEDEDLTTSHHPPSQITFISIDTSSTISPLTSKNPTHEPSPERPSTNSPSPNAPHTNNSPIPAQATYHPPTNLTKSYNTCTHHSH